MFFKKLKMKIKELQVENEQLKAHIFTLSSQLNQIQLDLIEHKKGLIFFRQRNEELVTELNNLNMKINTNNANQNNSRYY
jgi:chromosome segregation ATPase